MTLMLYFRGEESRARTARMSRQLALVSVGGTLANLAWHLLEPEQRLLSQCWILAEICPVSSTFGELDPFSLCLGILLGVLLGPLEACWLLR